MDFATLLETLKSPGEDTDIDSVYTDIGTAYTSVADELSSARAAVELLTDEKAALESELLKLKATNFDLLQRVSVDVESRDDVDTSDDGEDIEIVF